MSKLSIAHVDALRLLNELTYMQNLEAAETYIQHYADTELYVKVKVKLASFIKRELAGDGTNLSRLDRPEVSRSEVCGKTIVELVQTARGKKPNVVGCVAISVRKAIEEMLEVMAAETPEDICDELADVLVVLLTRSYGE